MKTPAARRAPAGKKTKMASAPCASLCICECQPAATSCARAPPLGPCCASVRVRFRFKHNPPSAPTAATWAARTGVHGGAHRAGRRPGRAGGPAGRAARAGAAARRAQLGALPGAGLLVAADRSAPLQHAPCMCELQRLATPLHACRNRPHQRVSRHMRLVVLNEGHKELVRMCVRPRLTCRHTVACRPPRAPWRDAQRRWRPSLTASQRACGRWSAAALPPMPLLVGRSQVVMSLMRQHSAAPMRCVLTPGSHHLSGAKEGV